MLSRDLRSRLDRQAQLAAKASSQAPSRALARALAASSQVQARWKNLLGTPAMSSQATVDDLRVAPLLASEWSQETVRGRNVYNYYTPDSYPCGCVATAMAQLMRFHSFPSEGIGQRTFGVTVDTVARNLSTLGGDDLGGPYPWASMPLVPLATNLTPAQCQAIGALCFDTGISVGMAYAASGSGAFMSTAAYALKTTFSYSSANYYYTGDELTGDGLGEMVQPSLDAGFPVLFGIIGDGGHAIVCDGYGYSGTTLYHHLNLGWGGSDDAWYSLPDIGTTYNFDLIDECIYNIYPSGTGEILSGRVTDAAGAPVPGVTVTSGALASTTDAQGIYALKGLAAGPATVTAAGAGHTFPMAMRLVGTSSDSTSIGNLWGVDLAEGSGATPLILPRPLDREVKLGGPATFTAGVTGQGPLQLSWTRNGVAVGSNSLTYTLEAASAADDQASIVLEATGPQGSTSSSATLTVVRLLNGTFEDGSSGWTLHNPWDIDVVAGPWAYGNVNPHGGSQWLCIGDWETACTDYAEQELEIPSNRTVDLSFWAGIANRPSTPGTVTNVFKVQVLDTDGNPLATLKTLDNTDAEVDASGDVVWKAYGPFSLTSWKGRTIKLRIGSDQPGGDRTGTIFAVDDVALFASDSGATATLGQEFRTLITGGSAPFTALVKGYASDNRVDWTVDTGGGAFNPTRTAGDGTATLFSSGPLPGTFTITAAPVETPSVSASARVTLVDPASVSLDLSPGASTVALGTKVAFTASVTPLTDTAVIWSCTGGSFQTAGNTTSTWSATGAGSYVITATSQGAPTRAATATVTVVDTQGVDLTMDPAGTTLLPGGSRAFTLAGDQGLEVAWDLDAPATQVARGLSSTVTVPAQGFLETAIYTLTASLVLDPTRAVTATILVKGMDLVPDGALDPRDLLALAAEWGKGSASPANLKGAGGVDDTDLAALLGQIP